MASQKWAPKNQAKKKANVSRGLYLCAECKQHVPTSIRVGGVRKNNIFVDHIKPIVDPLVGFVSWDEFVDRLFCEEDNLQVLCKECHDVKTKEERALRASVRKKSNEK
tara:strand:+ start:1164 stop:1487 length:324 start_codon:yes stop_codon:yes gene_type:complete